MSKDKQIEEITKILGCRMYDCKECKFSEGKYPECAIKYTADEIYTAGYRKASEVASEIFEEIEELLKRTCEKGYCGSINDLFAELKKKYTESEKDE